jgi:hypothetical protein
MTPFDGTNDAPPPTSAPARRPPPFVPTKVTKRPTAPKKKPAAKEPPIDRRTAADRHPATKAEVPFIDPRNAQRVEDDPPLRTNAVIADAVEKAIQGIAIARRLTIKKIEVKPEYGVDGELLTAEVRVGFGMIFARREE